MSSTDVFAYTHPTGYVFSTSEQVALSTALPLLAAQTKRRQLVLWGKIFGYKADYVIVQAYDDDLVAEPELYYTVDEGLTFTLLGTATSLLNAALEQQQQQQQHAKKAAEQQTQAQDSDALLACMHDPLAREELKEQLLQRMRGVFMGDPAYEYRLVDDVTGSVTSYKESLRLALFVEEHDFACRVAPRGAYVRVARHTTLPAEVHRNAAFAGLRRQPHEALSLQHYYHIRRHCPYRTLLARQRDVLSAKSALEQASERAPHIDAVFDAIADDLPAGVWQLHYDPIQNLVMGRNARFAGSLFYHVPGTPTQGVVYMGDGNINHNLAFEL